MVEREKGDTKEAVGKWAHQNIRQQVLRVNLRKDVGQ